MSIVKLNTREQVVLSSVLELKSQIKPQKVKFKSCSFFIFLGLHHMLVFKYPRGIYLSLSFL